MGIKATWIAVAFFSVIFFAHGHSFFKVKEQERGFYSTDTVATLVEQGNPQRRVAMLLLGAYGFASLLHRNRNRLGVNGSFGTTTAFFLVWAFASIAWTDDLGLTARRVVLLAMLWLGALGVATRFSLRQIMILAFSVPAVFLVVGICAELFFGTFRPFQAGVQFAGLDTGYRFSGTIDPNAGSWEIGMMLISAIFLSFSAKQYRRLLFVAGIVALLFLILSKTRTSFAAVVVSLIAGWFAVTSNKRKAVVLLGTLWVFCILYFAFSENVFTFVKTTMLLGREDSDSAAVSTLTGRTPLWKDLLSTSIVKRPLAGYGYGAFWTPKRLHQFPHMDSTALNGYIDMTLELGLIGAGAYILMLVLGSVKAIVLYKHSEDLDYVYVFSLCVFHAVTMVNESVNVIVCFSTFIIVSLLAKLAFDKSYSAKTPKAMSYRIPESSNLKFRFYPRRG